MYNDGKAICIGNTIAVGSLISNDGLATCVTNRRDKYLLLFNNRFNDMCEKSVDVNATENNCVSNIIVKSKDSFVSSVEIKNIIYKKPIESEVMVIDANAPVSLLTSSVIVVDGDNVSRSFKNFGLDKNRVKSMQVVVSCGDEKINNYDFGISFVREKPSKTNISTLPKYKSVPVGDSFRNNKINFKEIFTSVMDGRSTEINIIVNNIATVYVEDNKPPTPTLPNNSSLKSFTIVVQKYCYLEYLLKFEGVEITGIVGLPQGISFYDDRLKGTAKTSGDFNITIYLNDGTAVQGIIKVPEVPRQL